MSETSSDTESSCEWTIISNEVNKVLLQSIFICPVVLIMELSVILFLNSSGFIWFPAPKMSNKTVQNDLYEFLWFYYFVHFFCIAARNVSDIHSCQGLIWCLHIHFYLHNWLDLQGSDIETLGSEASVEYGAEVLQHPPVGETQLQHLQASASAGKNTFFLDLQMKINNELCPNYQIFLEKVFHFSKISHLDYIMCSRFNKYIKN